MNHKWLSRHSHLNVFIALFFLVLIGIGWGVTLQHIAFERADAIANAVTANSNLAIAVEEQTVRTLKRVGQVLAFVRRQYQSNGLRLSLKSLIADGGVDGGLVSYIGVTDEHANLVQGSKDFKPESFSGREYFKVHQRHDSDPLFIGKPIFGHIAQQWEIPISLRISKPNGAFGGIVFALVSPAYFTRFFEKVHLGEDDLVNLVGLDGIARALRTGKQDISGEDMRGSPILTAQAKSNNGSFLDQGKISGIPRLVSFRTLEHYPLIVAVGTSEAEALVSFHRRERNYTRGAVLISAFVLAFALGILALLSRQKRANAMIAKSEALFRATFDQASVGISRSALDGRFIQANQALCKLLGYTDQELLTRTPREITYPADIPASEKVISLLLDDQNEHFSKQIEKRYLGKDGSVVWVLAAISLVRDVSGKPSYFITVIQDISANKEAQERLRATFNQTAVGIAHVSADGHYIETNAHLSELLGYSHDELCSMTTKDVLHPDDFAQVLDNRRLLDESQCQTVVGELRYIRKNRSVAWVNRSVSVVRDPSGRAKYFISLVQDISERKLGEDALRESEVRFRSLTQMSSDFYWETDVEHRFTPRNSVANPSVPSVWRSQIGQRRWEIPYLSPDEAGWQAHRALLDAHQPFRDFVISRLGSDVAVHYLSVSGEPVFDASGTFSGYRGVGTDITERKHAEQQLQIAAAVFESQEGMIVTDAEKVILRVNRAFTDISGYTAKEAIGQKLSLLNSGRHDPAFYAEMWASIQRTGFWQGETWNRRKNGELYPEWLTITAVKGSDGEINHYVGTLRDITELKAAVIEIEHLAFYDPLTNLPNRRLLLDRLKQALATSTRSGREGALLFIDLDNFKDLNDTLGHDKGDLLLQQVAQRLTTCIREGDTVARLGGDEFVVMLKDLSESPQEAATQTEAIGEKILAILNAPYTLANYEHHSTPSIGITLFAGHQNTVDELLKRADLAMYQAKAAGRNTLRFFDPDMQAIVSTRAALEADLRQGLGESQFLLYYQPQVDGGGHLTGAEALVRWQHPQRGLVAPAEFIPLAEDTGLILPLGLWVLETACNQLVCWAAEPSKAHLILAVNVSSRQFRHPDFVDQVLALLDQTGADPHRLKLELTESLLLDDVEDTIAKMTTLKAKGVGFSLDDFGTGYSSLSYLKRLPLDQLKIDQSFVRDVLTDTNDAVIARTIVALARSLGLAVIAEGVETQGQRDFLATHGCRDCQGFFFAQPLPLEKFEDYLKLSQA